MGFILKGKYTEALITNQNTEEEALAQVKSITDSKAYEGCKIVIQPDAHCGKGSVIGFCCEPGEYIDPRTVGVDIGCTVSMVLYDKPVPKEKYADLNHKILSRCGWGMNVSPEKTYKDKEFFQFLSKEFCKAKSQHPDIFCYLPETVTEKWVKEILRRLGMDESKFWMSINSFGGGNHYCEYNENEKEGLYGITVHCGSRNLGVKVCNYWENRSHISYLNNSERKEITEKFKKQYAESHKDPDGNPDMHGFGEELKAHLEQAIIEKNKGKIDGFLSGEMKNGYFCDMFFACCYAKFNHIVIHRTIDEIVSKYGMNRVKEIVSVHNYIDFSGEKPIIRKGAIRAHKGEEILVPFNMRDGIAICEGLSNEEWLCSCSHGAGRKMSRNRAKENIGMEDFENSMKGIYSTCVCKGTLDESPMAYKDTEEIKNLIKETCNIKYLLTPKINIKATDGTE